MTKKYLIFGATGSVGSSLAEQLKNSTSIARFLITEESAWITKQIIAVDGGWTF